MVDQEVADILAEIRERVSAAHGLPASAVTESTRQQVSSVSPASSNGYTGLSVLARAWDRLPPVVSNRKGIAARLELWIKAKLKRSLRWVTWEQVNFNAATYRTFLEVVESLATYEQQLLRLQEQVSAEASQSERSRLEIDDALKIQRAELLSEIRIRQEQIEQQQAELNAQRSLLISQQLDLTARFDALEMGVNDFQTQSAGDAQTRFAELVKEFRERDERLLDEQRVCFKQLTLQLSESQVLQDRARRELESRVAKLERDAGRVMSE